MQKKLTLTQSLASISAISLLCWSASTPFAPSHALGVGVYAKAGILGAGVGGALGVTDHFSVRTDFTTAGTYNHDFTVNSLDYRVRLKTEQWGVYGDWFPFANGLRLSGGLHVRNLQAQARVHPTEQDSIRIGRINVPYGPEDELSAGVKFPTLAPYLGIGWGHHQTQKPGFGMVFDLGASFGKPATDLQISDSLRRKLRIASRIMDDDAEREFDEEKKAFNDKASQVAVFPHLYLGLSYWF